jgi:hypothetical protein
MMVTAHPFLIAVGELWVIHIEKVRCKEGIGVGYGQSVPE